MGGHELSKANIGLFCYASSNVECDVVADVRFLDSPSDRQQCLDLAISVFLFSPFLMRCLSLGDSNL